MRGVKSRFTYAVIVISAFLTVAFSAPQAHAQTGNWEDRRADLGGYLDLDTGLVWQEQSSGLATWTNANNSVNTLSNNSGHPWRLPTVAEFQLAVNHDINSYSIIQGDCWTSEAKNKGGARTAHYACNPLSGEAYLWGNNSLIHFIAVYRAYSP